MSAVLTFTSRQAVIAHLTDHGIPEGDAPRIVRAAVRSGGSTQRAGQLEIAYGTDSKWHVWEVTPRHG
jgi:hypothetical protein